MSEDEIVFESDTQSASPNWDHYVHLLGGALASIVAYWLYGALVGFIIIGISDFALLSLLSRLNLMIFAAEILVLLWIAVECLRAESEGE